MATSDLIPKDALQKGYDNEAAKIPELSAKMSELCKFVWAGSLALYFAALTAAKADAAGSFYAASKGFLLWAAVCGSLSLLLEYLQFAFGYKHAVKFVDWIEQTTKERIPITFESYNQSAVGPLLRLNDVCFVAKNVLAIGAAALMAAAVIRFAFA